MKTPEQLKGTIRNISKRENVASHEILQTYFFERLLERLSNSTYKRNFILKGGLLISSMLGISERTTMDMDATVVGIPVEKERVENIVREILAIDVGDNIVFELERTEPIRKSDEYNNFRIHIVSEYGKIHNKMKIDLTTGDKIVPDAVIYPFSSIIDDDAFEVYAYSVESILAEKYETILRRSVANTRMRDFYDLAILFERYRDVINPTNLRLAVESTASARGSLAQMSSYDSIVAEIKNDSNLRRLWRNYGVAEAYASRFSFDDVVENVAVFGKFIADAPRYADADCVARVKIIGETR